VIFRDELYSKLPLKIKCLLTVNNLMWQCERISLESHHLLLVNFVYSSVYMYGQGT
jgi:hypothetical protein